MSWPGDDQMPPRRGPGDREWHRAYRGIGTRISNWKLYENSDKHFQCKDCGYYWPTEPDTFEHPGQCWGCWKRDTDPKYINEQLAYASKLAHEEGGNKQKEDPSRVVEKQQAKAIVKRLDFGPKR